MLRVTLSRRRFILLLAGIAVVLALASTAGQVAQRFGVDDDLGLIARLYFGLESNVPTYFSSALLGIAALVLGVIARSKLGERDPFARHWVGLAAGFLFMSLDEAARLHEMLGGPTRDVLGDRVEEVFGVAWVVPGLVIVAIVVGVFGRFVLHLDRRFRGGVLAAAFLYLAGAIGLEMIGGHWAVTRGEGGGYIALVTLEELLEIAGVLVFLHAMLGYLETHVGEVRWSVTSDAASSRPDARAARPPGHAPGAVDSGR